MAGWLEGRKWYGDWRIEPLKAQREGAWEGWQQSCSRFKMRWNKDKERKTYLDIFGGARLIG